MLASATASKTSESCFFLWPQAGGKDSFNYLGHYSSNLLQTSCSCKPVPWKPRRHLVVCRTNATFFSSEGILEAITSQRSSQTIRSQSFRNPTRSYDHVLPTWQMSLTYLALSAYHLPLIPRRRFAQPLLARDSACPGKLIKKWTSKGKSQRNLEPDDAVAFAANCI